MSYIELNVDNFFKLRWLEKYLKGHNGYICGGCFKNALTDTKVKDIDIFFQTEEDWHAACKYFEARCTNCGNVECFDEMIEVVLESEKIYVFKYENSKVKAFTDKTTGITVELCRAVFGDVKDILNEFDFTVTKFAYYKELVEDDEKGQHWEYKMICIDTFFEHLFMKRLVLDNKIKFPVSTFERSLRYTRYGYGLCRESKMKLIKELRNLPEDAELSNNSLYDGMD